MSLTSLFLYIVLINPFSLSSQSIVAGLRRILSTTFFCSRNHAAHTTQKTMGGILQRRRSCLCLCLCSAPRLLSGCQRQSRPNKYMRAHRCPTAGNHILVIHPNLPLYIYKQRESITKGCWRAIIGSRGKGAGQDGLAHQLIGVGAATVDCGNAVFLIFS